MSINPSPDLWDRFLLRLQSYAYKRLRGHGIAIVTVRLVVQDGILVSWNDPESACFEPVGNQAEARLLALLCGEHAEPEIEVVAPAQAK